MPKVGKSWLAADLAICLALGLPWIGFEVPRAVKTALITREDNPALTKWRMNRLLAGKQRAMSELDGRLYINSREQSPEFRLDHPELLAAMVAELKRVQPEFVILDVFNILHAADENDNTEMREILDQLNRMRTEVGCSIGVVHHFNKNSDGTLTQRIRGAGAIAGWAEWCVGIESDCEDPNVKRAEFELKAAFAPESLCYVVRNDDLAGSTRIERVPFIAKKAKRQRAAEVLSMGGA
jgi:RecA-family ATPase